MNSLTATVFMVFTRLLRLIIGLLMVIFCLGEVLGGALKEGARSRTRTSLFGIGLLGALVRQPVRYHSGNFKDVLISLLGLGRRAILAHMKVRCWNRHSFFRGYLADVFNPD